MGVSHCVTLDLDVVIRGALWEMAGQVSRGVSAKDVR